MNAAKLQSASQFQKSQPKYSKLSLAQSIDAMSNHTSGVFDMIHDEKTAKIDPEKWVAINDPRVPPPATANEDHHVVVSGLPVRRVEPRLSTPGAHRVGDTESDYGGASDDDSESCLMVVPRAALVDDEQKDGVMKDLEAPTSKLPIAKARSFPDALHGSPSTKKSSHKRSFRCCMVFFCLLLAGLLGGILYIFCNNEFGNSTSLEAANANGNRNGNDNDNNDGSDNDGRRPSRGGNGDGGGNGRGKNNR